MGVVLGVVSYATGFLRGERGWIWAFTAIVGGSFDSIGIADVREDCM